MLLVLRMRWGGNRQRPLVNDRRNANSVNHIELLAPSSRRSLQTKNSPQGAADKSFSMKKNVMGKN
jgi:hypothetical protein